MSISVLTALLSVLSRNDLGALCAAVLLGLTGERSSTLSPYMEKVRFPGFIRHRVECNSNFAIHLIASTRNTSTRIISFNDLVKY